MKVYKDDFAKASAIARKVSPKFYFVEKNAVNTRSYLRVEEEYKAGNDEDTIHYEISVSLYVENLIEKIRTGEEKKDSLADIHIVLFPSKKALGLSQIYEVYSLEYFEELIDVLLKQLKNPVYVESDEYGNGYGFEEEEYIVLFKRDEDRNPFNSSTRLNKGHFQKIEKLKVQY